jgi:hypothetical protein
MLKSGFIFLTLGACILVSTTLIQHSVFASGCNREIVVPIKFSSGSTFWHHHGVGTTFVGHFTKGQALVADAVGVFSSDDNGKTTQTTEPWDLTIEGPNNFIEDNSGSDGTLKVTIPATGTYRIKTYPCAIWGSTGDVTITALKAGPSASVRAQTTQDEQAIADCAYQYAVQSGQIIMPHGLIIPPDAFLKTVESNPYYSSGASPQELCIRVAATVIGTMKSIDSIGH